MTGGCKQFNHDDGEEPGLTATEAVQFCDQVGEMESPGNTD